MLDATIFAALRFAIGHHWAATAGTHQLAAEKCWCRRRIILAARFRSSVNFLHTVPHPGRNYGLVRILVDYPIGFRFADVGLVLIRARTSPVLDEFAYVDRVT